MIPPLSGPVDFHPDLASIILIPDLKPGHVCCDKFSQCKPNVGRSKPPHPLNQCCFNAECWIWLLSALRCRGHHTYPAKPAFVGNVDYEGCRGDLLCFKAGAAFPWAKCSRTAECPCQGYMHGRTVHLKAKNDVSPYPLHLRAEKRDRVRPCLQRPCRWALHVMKYIYIYIIKPLFTPQ